MIMLKQLSITMSIKVALTRNQFQARDMLLTVYKIPILLSFSICFLISCTQTETLTKKDIESYEETIKARANWKSATLTIAEKLNNQGRIEETGKLFKLAEEHEFYIGCLSGKQQQAVPYKKGNEACHQERLK